jgi:hypothetical protein
LFLVLIRREERENMLHIRRWLEDHAQAVRAGQRSASP